MEREGAVFTLTPRSLSQGRRGASGPLSPKRPGRPGLLTQFPEGRGVGPGHRRSVCCWLSFEKYSGALFWSSKQKGAGRGLQLTDRSASITVEPLPSYESLYTDAHRHMHAHTGTHTGTHARTQSHTVTHKSLHRCAQAHRHTRVHTWAHMCAHTHTQAHTGTHVRTHNHTQAHTNLYTDVHRHMHVRTGTHVHVHRHTRVHTQSCTGTHDSLQMHSGTCMLTQAHRDAHVHTQAHMCAHRRAHTHTHPVHPVSVEPSVLQASVGGPSGSPELRGALMGGQGWECGRGPPGISTRPAQADISSHAGPGERTTAEQGQGRVEDRLGGRSGGHGSRLLGRGGAGAGGQG